MSSPRHQAKMRGMAWAKLYREMGTLYPDWPPPIEVDELGERMPVSEDEPADPFPSRADEGDEFTLLEIGDQMGVSRERIRQIETEALSKVRLALTVNVIHRTQRDLTELESRVLRNIQNGRSATDGRALRGYSKVGAARAVNRLVKMGKVT